MANKIELAHLADKVFNRPVMLDHRHMPVVLGALSDKLHIKHLTLGNIKLDAEALKNEAAAFSAPNREQDKPYQVIDGVARISLIGKLVHRFGYLKPMSGMTGYVGIRKQLDIAIADSDVKGILLDINSPGGEVSGCFDLSDFIASIEKPVWGVANEQATSAAYAVLSACDKVIAPETASIGSIGVIWAHTNLSKKMEKDGREITLIYSGQHKADGNPYAALPEKVQANIQEEMDGLRNLFASKVAKYRDLEQIAVLETEAKVYLGKKAVEIGLADEVMPATQVLQSFINHLSASDSQSKGGSFMTDKSQKATANAEPVTQTAEAAQPEQVETPVVVDTAAAKQEERQRIQAIIGSDEAQGRTALANHFAFSTDMSVESALAALTVAPAEAQTPAAPNRLMAAMEQEEQPNIGAEASCESAEMSAADRMLNAHKMATGV